MPIEIRGSQSLKRKLDRLGAVGRGRMLERALVAGGLVIQNEAKRRAPYHTGNLRRSIHIGGHDELNPDGGGITRRTGESVPQPEVGDTDAAIYIGTDVEYARRREFGFEDTDALGRTYHDPATPYMRPAVDTTRSGVAREVGDALRDLIRAAL